MTNNGAAPTHLESIWNQFRIIHNLQRSADPQTNNSFFSIWLILYFFKRQLVLWAEGLNSVNWLFCEFLRFNTAPLHFLVLLTVLIVAIRSYAFLGSCKRYRVSHIKYVYVRNIWMLLTERKRGMLYIAPTMFQSLDIKEK